MTEPKTFTIPLDRPTKPSECVVELTTGNLKIEAAYEPDPAYADPRTPDGHLELFTSLDGVTFVRQEGTGVAYELAKVAPRGYEPEAVFLGVPGRFAALAYVPASGGAGWRVRLTLSTEFVVSTAPMDWPRR